MGAQRRQQVAAVAVVVFDETGQLPFRVPLEAGVRAQDPEEFRQFDVRGDVEPPFRGRRCDDLGRLLGLLPRPGGPDLTRRIEGRPLRNVVDKRRGYVVEDAPPSERRAGRADGTA
ncbi:hypothetical protein ACWD46_29895 [Streptomyces sp. NPDC002486]